MLSRQLSPFLKWERRLDDERLLTGAAPDAFKSPDTIGFCSCGYCASNSLLGVIPTGFVAIAFI
jgi:hypothetical protein